MRYLLIKNRNEVPMCNGELKPGDYPTMDDPIGNDSLKSSGRKKQET